MFKSTALPGVDIYIVYNRFSDGPKLITNACICVIKFERFRIITILYPLLQNTHMVLCKRVQRRETQIRLFTTPAQARIKIIDFKTRFFSLRKCNRFRLPTVNTISFFFIRKVQWYYVAGGYLHLPLWHYNKA